VYKMKGWYRDNYRHSLAARGFTRRNAFVKVRLRNGEVIGMEEYKKREYKKTKNWVKLRLE
jgi:hypothetical protein